MSESKIEGFIVEFFGLLQTKPEQVAFITALELSGKNMLANKCKEVFEMGAE